MSTALHLVMLGGCPEQCIADVLDKSKRESSIVSLLRTDERARILDEECESSTDANDGVTEYWGIDVDGLEWRVHLY